MSCSPSSFLLPPSIPPPPASHGNHLPVSERQLHRPIEEVEVSEALAPCGERRESLGEDLPALLAPMQAQDAKSPRHFGLPDTLVCVHPRFHLALPGRGEVGLHDFKLKFLMSCMKQSVSQLARVY
eukprot:768368-Hanusia_phi.AAC.7